MPRLVVQLGHAIPAAGVALQDMLVRASYVGITGIVFELVGRIVLIAFHVIDLNQPRRHG